MLQTIDGKYQIVRLLGEGGMGAVYEARHRGTGRRVALKVIVGEALTNSSDAVARFQREARAAGAIETQHIVHVLDTGLDRDTGHPYMVMEYLHGEDVQQAISRLGPIHPEAALRILAQACIGLEKAHEAGVVHRDVKPANLYLAQQESSAGARGDIVVKLLDFGIAKVKMEQLTSSENVALTRTGSMLGSPLYMSPEQAKGARSTDHRTDIWSLGVVFYEALTGMTPYGHCDTLGGLIFAICSERPRPLQELAAWVPPEVAAIVHKALMHDANARFASAGEMGAAIRALLPHGISVRGEMLVPMTPEQRAIVAPKLAVAGAGTSPLGGSVVMPPAAVTTNPGFVGGPAAAAVSTASGVAHGLEKRGPGRAAIPIAICAALLLAAAGISLGRFALQRRPAAIASARSTPSESAMATASSAPVATASDLLAVTPAAPMRTVELAIVPATASVEVDHTVARVVDGSVTITGSPGSMHQVRVFAGNKETVGEIVIAESGAVPSKIELGTKPVAPPGGARLATPAAALQAGAPPKPATAAAPPPSQPPKAAPTASFQRTFE